MSVSRETALLEADGLWKRYEAEWVLQDLSLRVQQGEIVALLGPSGSGKSTLLRCIAGLERAELGEVYLNGGTITILPPHRRGFGMMFQHFALFPHRSVAENVAFGLRMQGVPKAIQRARVAEMLELVGLEGYGERSVFELSGGEQQRVALARSLAPSPPLLLLDEPLGSLDRTLRERLMDELRVILKDQGITALYVTHDQQEAFAIGDRLLLLHRGTKVQEGTPEQVYRHPATGFAADFFGLRNHLAIESLAREEESGYWVAKTGVGTIRFASEREPTPLLLVRPEAARLPHPELPNRIVGTVCERSFRGGHYRLVTMHGAGIELEWELSTPDQDLPPVGAEMALSLRPDAMTFLAPEAPTPRDQA